MDINIDMYRPAYKYFYFAFCKFNDIYIGKIHFLTN